MKITLDIENKTKYKVIELRCDVAERSLSKSLPRTDKKDKTSEQYGKKESGVWGKKVRFERLEHRVGFRELSYGAYI